jgi:ubiquinol-cytochrome c reductase iron-sulfur subunit
MRDDHGSPPTRRDFLCVSAGAVVAAGGGLAAWPLVDQMNPNPATPRPASCLVDLAPIEPGQAVTVAWKGQPVIIRHRTLDEIERARSISVDGLLDPFARNAARPASARASDDNRTQAGHPQWLVVVGLCTHLGCRLRPGDAADPGAGGEGWFCPCHAARFDLSGRVCSGPARTNLSVPPYRFVAPSKIAIGEDITCRNMAAPAEADRRA